jgi:hypothetical protein
MEFAGKVSMIAKFEATCAILDKIPQNIHAAFLILVGGILVLCKHEQAGQGLMMSGAAIFTHK